MPIVISYEDVEALGSAALQGGYQPGLAQGQAQYRGRQERDTRMLMDMQARRAASDRAFERQQILQGNQQEYAAGQAEAHRQASLQQFGMQQQAAQQADVRDFQEQMTLEEMRNRNIMQRQEADDVREFQMGAAEQQQERAQGVEMIQRATGLDPESAALAYDRLQFSRMQKQAGVQGAGGVGGEGAMIEERLGKLSGEYTEMGYMRALAGDFQGALQTAASVIEPGKRELAMSQAQNGIRTAIFDMAATPGGVDRLKQQLLNRNLPPEVRATIQSALIQQGDLRYGANQRTGQAPAQGGPRQNINTVRQGVPGGTSETTPEPDPSQLSDEELMRMYEERRRSGGSGPLGAAANDYLIYGTG